jgi:ADP-heptose:LPS heptosyltransferase
MGEIGLDLIRALWPTTAGSIDHLQPGYAGPPWASPGEAWNGPQYIVIHPGCGHPFKKWPESRWLELVDALIRRQASLVLCAVGKLEAPLARRLAAGVPPHRTTLFIDRAWSEFIALIAGAGCVICLDSSPAHVAAAFSVPTVAIYSGTNEIRLWGPANPNARILTSPTGCSPCHRAVGCKAMACVRDVTAEDVLAALDELGLF